MRKGKQFSKTASLSLLLLSYPRHIITKFFFEDPQLSSFFCQRTASPLTDRFSITDLITSYSTFEVRFFLCLPPSVKNKVVQNQKESFANMFSFVQHKRTPAEEMIKEGLSPHWVPSGIIESCHLCNWTVLCEFLQGKDMMTRAFWQKNCYF